MSKLLDLSYSIQVLSKASMWEHACPLIFASFVYKELQICTVLILRTPHPTVNKHWIQGLALPVPPFYVHLLPWQQWRQTMKKHNLTTKLKTSTKTKPWPKFDDVRILKFYLSFDLWLFSFFFLDWSFRRFPTTACARVFWKSLWLILGGFFQAKDPPSLARLAPRSASCNSSAMAALEQMKQKTE